MRRHHYCNRRHGYLGRGGYFLAMIFHEVG